MFKLFKKYPYLLTGISTKDDSAMGLSYQIESDTGIKGRRVKYFGKYGIDISRLITAGLVHSDQVVVVDTGQAGTVVRGTDALITKRNNLFLSVTVADCLPIFFFDPVKKIVALAHAGWRGVLKEIVRKTVRTMKSEFGSNPADILVGIGPHICADHYEVKAEVSRGFTQYGESVLLQRDGKTCLDLAIAAQVQLQAEGIAQESIEISEECTFNLDNKYFSYRRDRPENLETMLAFIGIRP